MRSPAGWPREPRRGAVSSRGNYPPVLDDDASHWHYETPSGDVLAATRPAMKSPGYKTAPDESGWPRRCFLLGAKPPSYEREALRAGHGSPEGALYP